MTVQDFERAVLALASWKESGKEGVDAMLSVAFTIRNLADRYSLGIGEAILKHQEIHGVSQILDEYPDSREPQFAKLLNRIDDIGTAFGEDLTNGALYYLNLAEETPDTLKFLLENPEEHFMCAVVGKRHFFK